MIRSATNIALTLCLGLSAAHHSFAQEAGEEGVEVKPFAAVVQSEDEASLLQKSSVIIGFNMTSQWMNGLKQQGVDFDKAAVMEGIRKAIEGEELGMTQEECQSCMEAFEKVVEKRQMEKMKSSADVNKAEGVAYLASHAQKPGVQKLANGVQYEVLNAGSGAAALVDDTVRIHYHGTLPDGTVFDSSVDRNEPAEFPVGGVVPGFSAALQAMKEGDKWRVVIPCELAYGVRGPGPIGPNRTLIFEIELLKVMK